MTKLKNICNDLSSFSNKTQNKVIWIDKTVFLLNLIVQGLTRSRNSLATRPRGYHSSSSSSSSGSYLYDWRVVKNSLSIIPEKISTSEENPPRETREGAPSDHKKWISYGARSRVETCYENCSRTTLHSVIQKSINQCYEHLVGIESKIYFFSGGSKIPEWFRRGSDPSSSKRWCWKCFE